MALWRCEFRTMISGKVEAATEREAMAKFQEALDGLDLQAGAIQDFAMTYNRAGYATEVEAVTAPKRPRKR